MIKQILVLGNPLNHEGGMVAFNKGLISTINNTNHNYRLKHFSIGSRMALFYYPILKRIVYPFLLILDLLRLCTVLLKRNIKVVQLNPSLIPVPLLRDSFVLLLNDLIFKKKSIIVLHGWKEHIYKKINRYKIYSFLIKKFFNSADVIYVLSEEFKQKLIKLDIDHTKIKVTTTFFYEQDIKTFTNQKPKSDVVQFIYLGRVSKIKGMDELINAFNIVKNGNYNFICNIIGHGDKPKTLDHYKNEVAQKSLDDKIKFLGRKTGYQKFQLLQSADIYIFPSYMEGCPTSAIEALASGLYVISTDVGALDDIITNANGIKVKPKQVKELADAIQNSIIKIDELRLKKEEISKNAFLNFEVNHVAEQFRNTYQSLI